MRSPVLLLLLATTAHASGFDARVAAAKAAIAMPGGRAYDMAMVPAIHAAIVPCVPASPDPAGAGAFVLVADVDSTGRVLSADVRPASPIARCFARHLGADRLRRPPAHLPRTWPIVVNMQTRR
ncbi:hypothetical protein [Cognatilysobacter lacus]|uniref:TonB C-terminal domain-containing protein n=1 Tax=Cognatilysobacter lacus TaxID=1643323 RepID=A0A5D8YYC7_9GAMM|nr:hypothetical protein [Lysobacter lacus]TZF86863.1 hypothetical protein FW784_11865 [Lysobacter lacus]